MPLFVFDCRVAAEAIVMDAAVVEQLVGRAARATLEDGTDSGDCIVDVATLDSDESGPRLRLHLLQTVESDPDGPALVSRTIETLDVGIVRDSALPSSGELRLFVDEQQRQLFGDLFPRPSAPLTIVVDTQ